MLVDDLKTLLATSFSYSLKTANYHWNIEGEDFIAFHPWLGELYADVYGSVDPLAEYIRTLQAYTPASLTRFQELSRVSDQLEVVQFPQIFEQLLTDTLLLIDLLNTTFDSATKERQQGIANFMAERLDAMQKYAWQIRATLKVIPGDAA
jgi:starvation-inducible DNA-binding protein